jgi:hypothetical protein
MKHIGQSSEEHASGTFNIAKDLTGLTPATYLGAIFVFPFPKGLQKSVSFSLAHDASHVEKDFSQLARIGSIGSGPAPGQPLTLNMDETSLYHDIRPKLAQNVYDFRVAINCKAPGAQSVSDEVIQKYRKLGLRTLRDRIAAGHNSVIVGIHQGNETTRAVKKGPVQDKVPGLAQNSQRRKLFKIIVNHTIKFCRAMPALTGQLPDRVAFNNPASEPLPFFRESGCGIAPTERASARTTVPALFTMRIMPVLLKVTGTLGTVFFCVKIPSSLNQFNDHGLILR